MSPDASGNFKGISVPELPWEQRVHEEDRPQNPNEDAASLRSKLSGVDGGASGKRNSQVPKDELRAWNEACKQAHINASLRQAEQS